MVQTRKWVTKWCGGKWMLKWQSGKAEARNSGRERIAIITIWAEFWTSRSCRWILCNATVQINFKLPAIREARPVPSSCTRFDQRREAFSRPDSSPNDGLSELLKINEGLHVIGLKENDRRCDCRRFAKNNIYDETLGDRNSKQQLSYEQLKSLYIRVKAQRKRLLYAIFNVIISLD